MSTIEAIVLRRVTFDKITLKSGALALQNYQMGFARGDKALIMRDDTGGFHEFSSDAINDEKYFSGRGALNAIPKFIDTGAIGNGSLTDDGTTIGWSTVTAPNIGSLSKPFLNTYSLACFEGGVSLASKYAAIDHDQAISTITGLSSALDGLSAAIAVKEKAWTRGTITSASNVDTLTTTGTWDVSNGASATGMPAGCYGWGTFIVLPYSTGTLTQIYTPHRPPTSAQSGMYIRMRYTNTFTDWQHIAGKDYADTIYALIGGTPTFSSVIAQETVQANHFYTDGLATFGSTAIQGICEMRANVSMGTQTSTSDSGGTIPSNVTGFINRATFTADRTRVLPYPTQGKIFFASNAGSSTAYDLILRPPSGVTIQYGISQLALKGGNLAGLKSVILSGATDTLWVVLSTYSL